MSKSEEVQKDQDSEVDSREHQSDGDKPETQQPQQLFGERMPPGEYLIACQNLRDYFAILKRWKEGEKNRVEEDTSEDSTH